ncbi:MAG: hypothetical protein Q9170_005869 [Blastenia crenularia]
MFLSVGDILQLSRLAADLYTKGWVVARGAPQDFRDLVHELLLLKDILYVVHKKVTRDSDLYGEPTKRVLQHCFDALSEFSSLVGKYEKLALSDRGHWFRRLQWSREQDSIQNCHSKLQKYQAWLQLVLTPEGRTILSEEQADENIPSEGANWAQSFSPGYEETKSYRDRPGTSFSQPSRSKTIDSSQTLISPYPSPRRTNDKPFALSPPRTSGPQYGADLAALAPLQKTPSQITGRSSISDSYRGSENSRPNQYFSKRPSDASVEDGLRQMSFNTIRSEDSLTGSSVENTNLQPLEIPEQREQHHCPDEVGVAFLQSFEAIGDEVLDESWIRIATWWLLKSVYLRSAKAAERRSSGADNFHLYSHWDDTTSEDQAYADLLKSSWILEELIRKRRVAGDLSKRQPRKLVIDLLKALKTDLHRRQHDRYCRSAPDTDVLLKQDLSLLESFEQTVEAKENVPQAMDDLTTSQRWITIDQDHAGFADERVTFRCWVNAQIGQRHERSKSSNAPYVILLWTKAGESEISVSLCNQQDTLNLSRKLTAEDIEDWKCLSADSTALHLEFPSQPAEINFLTVWHFQKFCEGPMQFFDAVKGRDPHSGELTIFQTVIGSYRNTSTSSASIHSAGGPEQRSFESCELRLYEQMDEMCWKTIRRLVVSSTADSKKLGSVSHWLPLSNVRLQVEDATVTITWSDCGHLEKKTQGNYNPYYSYVYRPNQPNQKIILVFHYGEDAQRFEDCILHLTETPPQVRLTNYIDGSTAFQETRLYSLFDPDDPDRGYHGVVYSKKSPKTYHCSQVGYVYRDLDFTFQNQDPTAIILHNVRVPHYISTRHKMLAKPKEREAMSQFREVTYLYQPLQLSFSCDEDAVKFLSGLTGWRLKFYRQCTKLVLTDTSRFRNPKKSYKSAEIHLWEKAATEGGNLTQLIALEVSGGGLGLPSGGVAELKGLSIQQGKDLDIKHMQANVEDGANSKSCWKVTITFKEMGDSNDFMVKTGLLTAFTQGLGFGLGLGTALPRDEWLRRESTNAKAESLPSKWDKLRNDAVEQEMNLRRRSTDTQAEDIFERSHQLQDGGEPTLKLALEVSASPSVGIPDRIATGLNSPEAERLAIPVVTLQHVGDNAVASRRSSVSFINWTPGVANLIDTSISLSDSSVPLGSHALSTARVTDMPRLRGNGYGFVETIDDLIDKFSPFPRQESLMPFRNSASEKPGLTRKQRDRLERNFAEMAKPNTSFKMNLANDLGLSSQRVNNWYQNRRALERSRLGKLMIEPLGLKSGDALESPSEFPLEADHFEEVESSSISINRDTHDTPFSDSIEDDTASVEEVPRAFFPGGVSSSEARGTASDTWRAVMTITEEFDRTRSTDDVISLANDAKAHAREIERGRSREFLLHAMSADSVGFTLKTSSPHDVAPRSMNIPVTGYGNTGSEVTKGRAISNRSVLPGSILDVNTQDTFDEMALDYAVETSSAEQFSFLLGVGAGLEARDITERDPLHTAIDSRLEPTAGLLLQQKVGASAMNKEGDDASVVAKHATRISPEIAELLENHEKWMNCDQDSSPIPTNANQSDSTRRPGPQQEGESEVLQSLPLKGSTEKPLRKSRKRTKTGCLTCRRRRIICGEERPTCNNCVKSKRNCEGYTARIIYKESLDLYGPLWGRQSFEKASVALSQASSKLSRASILPSLPETGALEGLKIGKGRSIMGPNGKPISKLVDGNPDDPIGNTLNEKGEFLDKDGDVVGRAMVVPSIDTLEGHEIGKGGKIFNENMDVIGQLIEGDAEEFAGQKINEAGEILDEDGDLVGRADVVPVKGLVEMLKAGYPITKSRLFTSSRDDTRPHGSPGSMHKPTADQVSTYGEQVAETVAVPIENVIEGKLDQAIASNLAHVPSISTAQPPFSEVSLDTGEERSFWVGYEFPEEMRKVTQFREENMQVRKATIHLRVPDSAASPPASISPTANPVKKKMTLGEYMNRRARKGEADDKSSLREISLTVIGIKDPTGTVVEALPGSPSEEHQDALQPSYPARVLQYPLDDLTNTGTNGGDPEVPSEAVTWGIRRLSESDMEDLFHRFSFRNNDESKDKEGRRRSFVEAAATKLLLKRSQSHSNESKATKHQPSSPLDLEHNETDNFSSTRPKHPPIMENSITATASDEGGIASTPSRWDETPNNTKKQEMLSRRQPTTTQAKDITEYLIRLPDDSTATALASRAESSASTAPVRHDVEVWQESGIELPLTAALNLQHREIADVEAIEEEERVASKALFSSRKILIPRKAKRSSNLLASTPSIFPRSVISKPITSEAGALNTEDDTNARAQIFSNLTNLFLNRSRPFDDVFRFSSPKRSRYPPRLSQEQIDVLEYSFRRNAKPSTSFKKLLAIGIHGSFQSISLWYQDRRAKEQFQRRFPQQGYLTHNLAAKPDENLNVLSARARDYLAINTASEEYSVILRYNEKSSAQANVINRTDLATVEDLVESWWSQKHAVRLIDEYPRSTGLVALNYWIRLRMSLQPSITGLGERTPVRFVPTANGWRRRLARLDPGPKYFVVDEAIDLDEDSPPSETHSTCHAGEKVLDIPELEELRIKAFTSEELGNLSDSGKSPESGSSDFDEPVDNAAKVSDWILKSVDPILETTAEPTIIASLATNVSLEARSEKESSVPLDFTLTCRGRSRTSVDSLKVPGSTERSKTELPGFQRQGLAEASKSMGSACFSAVMNFISPTPPIPAGKTRISWTCSCGDELYDDFVETRPGAAKELMTALHVASQERPSGQPPSSSTASASSHYSNTTATVGSVSSTAEQPSLSSGTSASSYSPHPTDGRPTSTAIQCGPEIKWLLVCAQAWQRPTTLLHLNVCSTTSDQQLFTELRQLYQQLKRAWWHKFSLKRVRSIRFIQFELHPRDLVDVRKVPDMPPATKKEEYTYQPCDLLPPIGENLMTHLFHHPHEANEQAITFLRSPKKRKQKLAVCPQMGTNVGWGIHLVEGWAVTKVWLLALAIFLISSLVFAVAWSVLEHDIQGAFSVAAYFVAVCGMGVGTVQAFVDQA